MSSTGRKGTHRRGRIILYALHQRLGQVGGGVCAALGGEKRSAWFPFVPQAFAVVRRQLSWLPLCRRKLRLGGIDSVPVGRKPGPAWLSERPLASTIALMFQWPLCAASCPTEETQACSYWPINRSFLAAGMKFDFPNVFSANKLGSLCLPGRKPNPPVKIRPLLGDNERLCLCRPCSHESLSAAKASGRRPGFPGDSRQGPSHFCVPARNNAALSRPASCALWVSRQLETD